ncbi:MAG: histidine phosphatase family protein [Gammaproteobacteria bacterium]|nr:histidine phosphatase family protein [Gammaproteobacteria bacterium]MBU0787684.1 histidine phosphatase family protein [Gammaproteobacteria bacterium]MBU0814846.1 histidine phosphatase family protein [Gammaproteobacteria bacterium]MBU1786046.1 histidine phosphatase family protein [Gammaproteobacteria bacterium]
MTELILIRHGETDWNRELRFQGQVDVPLNATGHEQARRLALRLAQEPAHRLVSSDLLRAQQTAAPLALHRLHGPHLDFMSDAGLREQNFGQVDGMQVADIKQQHADSWAQWIQFGEDYAFTGGETTRQFHARVMAAVRALVQKHAQQTLVVVTHGGVLDMIYRTARALPLSGPRQSDIPNAGLNRVRIQGDVIDILSWADTQHLAGLPPQPVYDQSKLTPVPPLKS